MTAAEREAELRRREALRDQHKLIYRALYSAGEGELRAPRAVTLLCGSVVAWVSGTVVLPADCDLWDSQQD